MSGEANLNGVRSCLAPIASVMTNPQLTKNLLEVIWSLPVEDRRWLLEQLGGEAVDLSSQDLAELALVGQAFDDLAQEPDLYSFSDGEAIAAA